MKFTFDIGKVFYDDGTVDDALSAHLHKDNRIWHSATTLKEDASINDILDTVKILVNTCLRKC